MTRREILRLLDKEHQQIIANAKRPGSDPLMYDFANLDWYLQMAKNWASVALLQLSKQKSAGRLIEIGAGYGLASGAACRMGWQADAVDFSPIPNFSGLADPSRRANTAVCNICTDPLPFESSSFDAVVFLEVLEHLPYSPAFAFREMRRVLKTGGLLYLTTPHRDSLGRIFGLIMGKNHEPLAELFLKDDDPFTYKGLTFFHSGREHRLWTARELNTYLPTWGFRVLDSYYYGSTVYDPNYASVLQRIASMSRALLGPVVRYSRLLGGGGIFLLAEAEAPSGETLRPARRASEAPPPA